MIITVIMCLCCVISEQIQARPSIIMGQDINIRRIREENDAYGTQLNGNSQRIPAWSQAKKQAEKMFLLPTKLNKGDRINITGVTASDPQHFRIAVSLVTGSYQPDYNNIACELHLNFQDETTVVKTIVNGQTEEFTVHLRPSDLIPEFPETAEFTVSVENNESEVEFYLNDSFVEKISLKHHIGNIRFLLLHGDVEKVKRLDFLFA